MSSPNKSRTNFKPVRPSSLSTSSFPVVSLSLNKENNTTSSPFRMTAATAGTTTPVRRKRAQSLGGAESAGGSAARSKKVKGDATEEIHQADRRGLAPRRSILKAAPLSVHANTTSFTSSSATLSNNTAANSAAFSASTGRLRSRGNHTTDLSYLSAEPFGTRPQAGVVSTPTPAPEDDSEDDDSEEDDEDQQEIEREQRMREERRKSLARRVSFAPNAHIRLFTSEDPTQTSLPPPNTAAASVTLPSPTSSDAHPASEDDEDVEEEEEEMSMVLATSETTMAFASHFGGTKVPLEMFDADSSSSASDGEDDGEGSMEMEVAADGVTRSFAAFASAAAAGIPHPAPSLAPAPLLPAPTKNKPRHSEIARDEDAEDAEIFAQLGLKPIAAAKARGGKAKVVFGGVPMSSSSGDEGAASGEEDEDDDTMEMDDATGEMDMTVAVGSITSGAAAARRSVGGAGKGRASLALRRTATIEVEEEEQTMDMSMVDRTMEMDDQTMEMDQTTSFAGRILSTATPLTLAGVSTPSTPSARLQASLFARQSLGGVAGPALASPARASPRRALLPPSAAAQNNVTVKSPGRSSAGTPTRATPVKAPMSAGGRTPTRTMTPSKTPTKATLFSSATKASAAKMVVQSIGAMKSGGNTRSPGGSLSLRGLLDRSSVGGAAVAWGGAEDDITDSSFGGLEDDDESALDRAIVPILSLDDWLETAGSFMKDILGMTGVRSGLNEGGEKPRGGRKSIAGKIGGTGMGKPEFADLVVAGGCKSLFHQLYLSDQSRLHDDILEIEQSLSQIDQALAFEQPRVFSEWSGATESHRAIMQGQFRMIKWYYHLIGRIDWNECRGLNYQSIIEVMEDNLAGLYNDNAVLEAATFETIIPEQQARHAALLKELLEERTRDLELSACDDEELGELQSAVVEQSEQLQIHSFHHDGVLQQLNALKAKDADLELQESEMVQQRDEFRNRLLGQVRFTRVEVGRLQAEYESLQHLFGWKLIKFDRHQVTLRHWDRINVVLSLASNVVSAVSMDLHPVVDRSGKRLSVVTEVETFLFNQLKGDIELVLQEGRQEARHPRMILERIANLWTNARAILQETYLLALRYPSTTSLSDSTLTISSTVHIPSSKASFVVGFEVTGEEMWDGSEEDRRVIATELVVGCIGADVRVSFGAIDLETVKICVRETLDNGGRGAMVEAIREAERKCGTVA